MKKIIVVDNRSKPIPSNTFTVKELVNTVEFQIGQELDEYQINSLIRKQVTVKVVSK